MKTEIFISSNDEHTQVMALLEKQGYRWCSGHSPLNHLSWLPPPFKLYADSDKKVLTHMPASHRTSYHVSSTTAAAWLHNQGATKMTKTLHEMATEAMNLQPGDTVKVLFAMPGRVHGWENTWTPEMDTLVGNTYTVKSPEHEGSALGAMLHTACFPNVSPICLELVSRKPQVPDYPRLFLGSHKVLISPAGIKVGCQTFSFEEEERLARLVRDDFVLREDLYYVTRVAVRGTPVPLTELKRFLDDIHPAVAYYRDK